MPISHPPDYPPDEGARRDERLRRAERLTKRADYLRCYRTGRRRQSEAVILYFAANTLGHARIGITASRKVGNAVARHRLKRQILETYRRWPGRRQAGPFDFVVHLKPKVPVADLAVFRGELERLLRSLPRAGTGSERPAAR